MEDLSRFKGVFTTDELKEMAQDVNSWNGELDYLEYYENDEYFFNDFFNGNVIEAVRAVSYGNYNYMDEYVKFDGYGNLESASEYDVEKEIEDNEEEIIDAYIRNIDNMYNDEIKDKIQELLDEEETEE